MHKKLLAISLLSVLTLGAGCQASPSTPGAPQKTGSFGWGGGNNCDHPYYPLKAGTKITYETSVGARKNTFSWEVVKASTEEAQIKYHFEPSTDVVSNISCDGSGLIVKEFVNPSNAGATQSTSKTLSTSGNFLPKNLNATSKWSNEFVVETTNTNPDLVRLGLAKTVMTISSNNKSLGETSVTTPAGTFTAMKVEQKTSMRITLNDGKPDLVTDTVTMNYFVQGKGLVKSETEDQYAGKIDMDAVSIQIP